MNLRLPLAIAVLVLSASGCADDADRAGGPSTGEPSTSVATPGDPATTWDATEPASPVDEHEVQASYDGLLDAVTEAVDGQSPDLTWSASTLRTEELDGVCAITLERTADGEVPPPGDDTRDLGEVDAVLGSAGFGTLEMADDPGGALRYLADDEGGALFELRSKEVATVAVRVPTATESCTS